MVEILFETNTPTLDTALIIAADSIENALKSGNGLTGDEVAVLSNALSRDEFKAENGSIYTVETASRKIGIAIVKDDSPAPEIQTTGGKLYKALSRVHNAAVYAPTALIAYNLAFGAELGSYRFDKYLTKKSPESFPKLETVTFHAPESSKEGYAPYAALAAGVRYARDLTNEPANNMTPAIMANDIKRLEYLGLKVEILDQEAMHEKEFNLALSVAQGSCNPPRIAVIQWKGKTSDDVFDLGLVGKGVTFDSGGISLKPGAGMWDMKQDMAGAAAVVGAMKTAALQKIPLNVVAVVGLVENMPSGSATRPGDIVRSMSGQTVEILNTDAEGRLVLADCLWYIQENYKVEKIIDIATLTGAILVALGKEMAGVMGNSQNFTDMIFQSGETSGEKVWQLPINKAYNKMMDSAVADMKNISESRNAGSITAACFLQRFIRNNVQWAHLDIAGMDKEEKGTPLTPKGASGFGVRLFNRIMKSL